VVVAALIAIAAIAHASWNLAIKRAGTGGVVFLWLTFVVGAVVFAPLGIATLVESGPSWLWLAAVSGALQVGYFLLLQRAYRRGDVSVVYPLARGTGPLLSVLFAIILFGEHPSALQLIGAGVVIAGVVTIGLAGGRAGAVVNRPGVLYGLAVGVAIATYTLWDANAVLHGGMPPLGYYWAVVACCVILAPVAVRQRAIVVSTARRHWIAALVVGVLCPLAYVLILLAVQLAPVSIVAPAREVSVVLVALAGWLWLREPHPVQRIIGAVVVLTGVALLALPLN
jgi:drug/metabolite transporter (DMT)-like permease